MKGKIFGYLKTIFKLTIIMGIITGCFAIIAIMSIENKGKESIISNLDNLPNNVDAIIILGAGVDNKGNPSDILVDRLETAIDIYDKNVEYKFLLSGDHGREGYNEVGSMKDYILKERNIKEKDIFLDHAGFSTYETMYRAKEIFEIEKAIIVTNKYHLPRALYLADKFGIEALGVPSDKRNYLNIKDYSIREKVAQIKDYMYVNILKPEPKFLGESIPVNTSDGRSTDDNL